VNAERRETIKRLLYRLMVVFLAGYVAYTLVFSGVGREKLELGAPLGDQPAAKLLYPTPDYAFAALNGSPVKLSDYRGKTIVLNIWAPWCPPCRQELPWLETLARRADKNTVVLLAATQFADAGEVARLARENKIERARVLLDGEGELTEVFNAPSLPTTYIIDPHGIIRYRISGARAWDSGSALEDVLLVSQCGPQGHPDHAGHGH
jgi:thiol-disulfide isomerase/thioredoxin